MKQFEYKAVTFGCGQNDCSNVSSSQLNEYGEEGWEMVSVIREPYKVIVFFKREINE